MSDDMISKTAALDAAPSCFACGWHDAIGALPTVTVGVSEATVHRAVLDWIRDDAGAAVKMSMTPVLANALTARILAALTTQPAPDAQAIREAALREAILWIEEGMVIVAPEGVPQRTALDSYRKQFASLVRTLLTQKGGA